VGDLITDDDFSKLITSLQSTEHSVVAVGDTTTLNLVKAGLIPDLSIIDLGTRRGRLAAEDIQDMEHFTAKARILDINNPREEITTELWNAVRDFYSEFHSSPEDPQSDEHLESNHNKFKILRPGRMGTTPLIIRIEGEEDLASLPCVYFATDGGHVMYGLPDVGLIHIQVDETQRTIVRDALRKMEALYEPHNNQSN